MKHATATLQDKYRPDIDRVYLTGTQALVRLPILQRTLDARAGRNTAGFVSGYRGSPLGSVDIQMWAAREHLAAHHVHFQPGLNEELAATAVWGSQQGPLMRGAKYDGVFAFWYGKGPGVDRSGDVFKHANYAGTSRWGGALLVAGDDHGCKSSTIPHQTERAFIGAAIPVLAPADVRDILELGLLGWGMSRWSGRYVAIKTVADVVDSSATVLFDLDTLRIADPDGPHPDVSIRIPDAPMEQEARLFRVGLPAALDYARANDVDRLVLDPPGARLGIVTAGKSYHDTRQAIAALGLGDGAAAGIRLLKLGMVWPLVPETLAAFAQGLEEIVVVEEKAPIIEQQVRDLLYDRVVRPRVVGKRDEAGAALLKDYGELPSHEIALALAGRIARFADSETLRSRVAALRARAEHVAGLEQLAARKPFYCSGCPHNTSTKVIDGSRALGGIGCHTLALWMDRSTDTVSAMGGEGAQWIGQAPFTEEAHVFANIGDGTYFHSGILAIRAAVAARVNITYKLLFNDAVAMTGGQKVDGPLTVPQITRQLAAEDVVRIAVVTDEPEKHDGVRDFAPGVTVHHRRDLQQVERQFRDTPGATVIIYDQTCASEKRRRRKRGTFPDPDRRVVINQAVCEACGDCSRTSNCMSVVPVDTEFGTKREIDQSSCNKDFSCAEGFCPSFVSVHGAALRKRARVAPDTAGLAEPVQVPLHRPWNVLVTGVGGTGIVTVGALIGAAAHADGLHATVLDQMGMAQKGGSVWSHIRIAPDVAGLHGLRVGQGGADLLLGCDLVVAAARDSLATLRQGASHVVLNTHEAPTADFVLDTETRLPGARLRRQLTEAAEPALVDMLDASALAAALLGDAIGANVLLLGYAWQKGLLPLSLAGLLHAIELNGAAVEANKAAFAWGRLAAADLPRVMQAAGLSTDAPAPRTLDGLIDHRATHLRAYQGAALARRYRDLVARVREAEAHRFSGGTALTEAVARGYHRLLAYKDEYEVARLYTDGTFQRQLAAQFEEPRRLELHLAPPLLARRDPQTGHLRKRAFGPWILPAFGVLRRLRFLRGSPLDPFGRTEERRAERALITEYEADIAHILPRLQAETLPAAVALASLPETIRGFGHVKERAMRRAATDRAALRAKIAAPASRAHAA